MVAQEERVFVLLKQYRERVGANQCRMDCPIGNLALEVSGGNPEARELIHRNFESWAGRVEGWLRSAANDLPVGTDLRRLSRFVLTVMEGGLTQARAAGHLGPFRRFRRRAARSLHRTARARRCGQSRRRARRQKIQAHTQAQTGEITMRLGVLLLLGLCSTASADELSFANEGVVEAPIEEVWKIFATSEGYTVLGPALAEVDLRIGGMIRSRYRADGTLGDAETIENTILAYEPPRMMALRIAKTPASFPFKNAWKSTWTVITLAPVESRKTLVRAASLGFGTDEESVAMRRFFEAGNQSVIANVQRHFASGSTP